MFASSANLLAAAPGRATLPLREETPTGEAVPRDARVAVLAADAPAVREVLGEQGISSVACGRACDLARLVREGSGAAVLEVAAVDAAGLKVLVEALRHQPAWSDLPLIVLPDGGLISGGRLGGASTLEALEAAGNVTVLERPIAVKTLVSAVRVALRSRRRQYQTRHLLRQLEEGVAQRDRLLAMLGHELRNPLAAIQAAHELLKRQEAEEADAASDDETGGESRASAKRRTDRRHHLRLIGRQARQLVRMVDDLLDIGRIRLGKITLRRRPLDVNELARRCAESAAAAASRRGHTLVVQAAAGPVVVEADAVRLEQVLSNLLSNAMKYSPDGGTVTLSVATDGGWAVVRLADAGVGMPPEVMRGVFELFTQADESMDRAEGGLGLGLPLVRSLVEGHGGTVSAASEGEGRGSVFTVRLPLAGATAGEVQPVTKSNGEKDLHAPAARRHVLLVEDQPDMRDVMARLLRGWGHRVETAASGPAGVEAAVTHRPDIALIDVGLPGLNGYQVAQRVRAELGMGVRLIALTGYGQPEDRRRSAEAGFDVHLVKPVDFAALRAILAE